MENGKSFIGGCEKNHKECRKDREKTRTKTLAKAKIKECRLASVARSHEINIPPRFDFCQHFFA